MNQEKHDAIKDLHRLQGECSSPNWDGYGARIVYKHVVDQAIWFIRAMPEGMPMPEFCGEPDGCISLDWIVSLDCTLNLSIGMGRKIPFVFKDGTQITRGVISFNGRDFPKEIAEMVKKVQKIAESEIPMPENTGETLQTVAGIERKCV